MKHTPKPPNMQQEEIEKEAERLYPISDEAKRILNYKRYIAFREGAHFGYNLRNEEVERLKGLIDDIDNSLYIGEDLQDKDILSFYMDVARNIKQYISDFKQQHNL